MKSITKVFFLATLFFSLLWVCISYGIAIYATLKLGQVYTMSELSEPAITVIIGAVTLKVVENIFEHNDGALFGTSKKKGEE